MSESTSPRVTFNKKLKFEVGKPKSSKRSENNDGGSERGTFKRGPRSSSREEDDGKRGYGEESSNLKRKRVYGERGVEKGGESKNGGVHNKTGYERRKSRVKDDVSDIDRLNRAKFSSSRGKNTRKDEFSEARCRKREVGSSRGYKEKERRGGEESFDGKFKAKVKTRERLVSSRRGENVDDEFDSKFKSQTKTRERWASSKRDGESDSKFESQGKTRERWPSTKRDGESDRKLTTKDKARDRLSFTKHDNAEDGSHKQDTRNRTDSDRQVDSKSNNRREVGVVDNSKKKMLRSKKSEEENILEDGPRKKKKKKRLGIHPYDISSKKVDDGISIDGTTVEKKVDPNKDVEISQNAQFRAIQPSPSILSFVEDNLLGRRRSIDLRRAGYNIDFSSPLDNVPLSTSTERERIEEAVFRNKLEFFAAAKVSSSFPAAELPEIAFAGRSNVGKSSLLNSLTRQWGVVRTSDKPGLTQTINFFKLGKKLCMVDLPGYGFAYAKEEVKDAWEELVKEYVSTRVGLKRVCLLIDTKWGMKPRDQELINLMERSQTKYQIVLTKSDTVFPMDVARRAMQIEEALKANKSVVQPVMMVSSKSGGGIRSLRTVLAKVARFVKV